jgi:hypothetical protein
MTEKNPAPQVPAKATSGTIGRDVPAHIQAEVPTPAVAGPTPRCDALFAEVDDTPLSGSWGRVAKLARELERDAILFKELYHKAQQDKCEAQDAASDALRAVRPEGREQEFEIVGMWDGSTTRWTAYEPVIGDNLFRPRRPQEER